MKFTEGAGVVDSIYGKSQLPIKMFLEKRGEQFEQESVVKSLFNMQKSEHWAERMTSMTGMEGFKAVGENGAYPLDDAEEGYHKDLVHMTWKNSFSISQELIEDAKIMDLRKKPDAFVTSFYRTREKFGAAILGAAIGGNTALSFAGRSFDIAGADSQALFYASHPNKVTGTTQSNIFSDAFDADALGKMETTMQNFTGDNDEILDVAPDTIVIPNIFALKKAVFAAIGADKDPDTANNGFNYQFGRWTIIVWSYLNQFITANTAPWILFDSDYNDRYVTLPWLDRTELTVRSTVDENTDANVWRGRARFVAGVNDWRGISLGGIATAGALS